MAAGIERPQSDLGASGSNARGIAAMLSAMAFFCTSDSAIKIAGETLPVGELMFLRGLFGTMFIFIIARYTGSIRNYPTMFNGKVLWRTVCDAAATICFITGVVMMPFANASAIAQVTPLVVTALAAILLGEPVGWRRWAATAVGLVGVIIIIKPGTDAFQWAALWVIASVIFVAVRDIHTRKMGAGFDPILLTGMSTIGVMLTGLAQAPLQAWSVPSLTNVLLIMLAASCAAIGQYSIILAMRAGEVAVIGPFRYSVIVFAVISGIVVFGERPTISTYIGILIVVAAGVYTFHREGVRRKEAKSARAAREVENQLEAERSGRDQ